MMMLAAFADVNGNPRRKHGGSDKMAPEPACQSTLHHFGDLAGRPSCQKQNTSGGVCSWQETTKPALFSFPATG